MIIKIIFTISAMMTVFMFPKVWGNIDDGKTKESWISSLVLLVLIIIVGITIVADSERTDLINYRINQGQIKTVEYRKEQVKNELEELVNKLPEDTLDLYKEIGNKKDTINFYPDIEFVNLIEEQMKSQRELEKELTALYQEQAMIKADMENRRMFFPGKLMYKDNVVEKLKEIK